MALTTIAERLPADALSLYGDDDPRDQPWYTYPEAARATGIPVSTLRAWTIGQRYRRKDGRGFFEPVISRPSEDDPRVSFTNVIEAHVLRALRTVHEVRLDYIREAVQTAEAEFGIERLLVSPDLRTSAGQLFLDHYTGLLELSASKQYALRGVMRQFLSRIEFDSDDLPIEFSPFGRLPESDQEKLISLSPFVSFGRAVVRSRGISTRVISDRLDVGEAPEDVMADYDLTEVEIEEAVLYEAAA